MPKASQTPATALNTIMEEYQLNPSSLAKQIGLSASAVRKISLGESGISVPTALRLAKLFGNSPSFWLNVQLQSDLQAATANKELQAALKGIPLAAKPVQKKLAGKKAPVAAKKAKKSPRKKAK